MVLLIKCVRSAKRELGALLSWIPFLSWAKGCFYDFFNNPKNKEDVFYSTLHASLCTALSSFFLGIACHLGSISTQGFFETGAQASGIVFFSTNAFSFLALGAMLACHPFEDVFDHMRHQIQAGNPTSLLKAQATELARALEKTTRTSGISSNSSKRL